MKLLGIEMAVECCSGLMVQCMKATGRKIRQTEMEESFTQIETSTLVNGKMIRHMDSENLFIVMELPTKVNG